MYFYGYRQHQPHAFVNKLKKNKLCNAVSRVAKKGEGWYIIMAVFSDILYKTSDRACCYHRLLLILCNESTNDTLQQMSSHVNL